MSVHSLNLPAQLKNSRWLHGQVDRNPIEPWAGHTLGSSARFCFSVWAHQLCTSKHWQPLGCLQVQLQRWASAAALTLHRPGRRLIVAAPEEVAAHEHPLGPCLAPAVCDAVDAIVAHGLVHGGRVG